MTDGLPVFVLGDVLYRVVLSHLVFDFFQLLFLGRTTVPKDGTYFFERLQSSKQHTEAMNTMPRAFAIDPAAHWPISTMPLS